MNFLDRVLAQKRAELATRSARVPIEALRERAGDEPPRDFATALDSGPAIIAEVKRKSPKVDRFLQAGNVDMLPRIYEAAGASAMSVVTDVAHFGTSLSDARRFRDGVSLPLLVKDFIIDPYQVYEARTFGADAVLLISRILDDKDLGMMLEHVRALGMEALVEVHDEADLAKAKNAGASVIGINNRDLDTLSVTLDTTRRLAVTIGEGITVVSESGIGSHREIIELSRYGVHAFLIGGALLQSPDPGALLYELLGHDTSQPHSFRKAE